MNVMDPAVRGLLAKYVAAGADEDVEIALLISLPAAKQQIVLDRLAVMDRYLSQPQPTVEEAEKAAASLGMAKRNFYRLLSKLKELGPVRGLSPKFRNSPAAFPVHSGLSELAEEVVRAFVTGDSNLKMTDMIELVMDRSRQAGEAPPSAATIRRRVEVLRREGLAVRHDARLGRRIVIDQVTIDLPVRFPAGVERPIATFIIDRDTLVILGAGLAQSKAAGAGFQRALRDLERGRLADLADLTAIPFAKQIEGIDWVVDQGLDSRVAMVERDSRLLTPTLDFSIHLGGQRRSGKLLTKLLGDRLGTLQFMLKPRVTRLAESPETPTIDARTATNILSAQISIWNAKAIERLDQSDWHVQKDRQKRGEAIVEALNLSMGGIVGGRVGVLIE